MADSGWEDLPMHLLDSIFSKLESCVDYLRFGLVCERWRSNAVESFDKQKLNNHLAPLLLVPTRYKRRDKWRLYSWLDEKFLLGSKLQLPKYRTPFRCSSEGWLVTIDRNLAVTLRNLFTTKQDSSSVIRLPPLPLVPPLWRVNQDFLSCINKIFTFTPNPEDPTDLVCVLLLGCCCHVFCIQPRKDTEWTRPSFEPHCQFHDVVYYNNRFYAVSRWNKLFAFDSFGTQAELISAIEVPYVDFCHRYLVKSVDGELLQVEMRLSPGPNHHTCFIVFKFCFETCSWIKVDSLGDSALFLGEDGSISVSASASASRFSKCKPNHIYFLRDDSFAFGEYNLETGSITTLSSFISPTILCNPWTMPLLCNTSFTCLPMSSWLSPIVRF